MLDALEYHLLHLTFIYLLIADEGGITEVETLEIM